MRWLVTEAPAEVEGEGVRRYALYASFGVLCRIDRLQPLVDAVAFHLKIPRTASGT